MDNVVLDYVVPSADCAAYVTLFYHFRCAHAQFEDTERADHAQLRFRLTPGTAEYYFFDGRRMEAPAIHLVGPTTGASRVRCDGPVEVFGCGIAPEGWAVLVGAGASEVCDQVIDAVALFGAPATLAAAALASAADAPAMVAVVERMLLTLVRRTDEAVGPFVAKVDRWLATAASPDLEALVAATGLSPRQLERKCKALYGAPPKLLARKYRALRTGAAIVSGRLSPTDMLDRGFYDQSHMIREVKRFTGFTPGQIASTSNILAKLTVAGRDAFGDSVQPLISDT